MFVVFINTLPDYEVIIVNDGSSIVSQLIIDNYDLIEVGVAAILN